MRQYWWFVAVLLAGCGTDPDERKPTSDVVVLEIMRPSCGQVQCHSSTTQAEGFVFDTIEGTKATINNPDLDASAADIGDALRGLRDKERMPPDSPLADADIKLIGDWFLAGMPDTLP